MSMNTLCKKLLCVLPLGLLMVCFVMRGFGCLDLLAQESGLQAPPSPTQISFGLGHNDKHQTPTIAKDAKAVLDNFNGLYVGDTTQNKVYITFDLGYEPGYTGQILDILRDNGVHAVFFLTSHYLSETSLVQRMIAEGHSIGNHTHKHKNLPTLSRQECYDDIHNFEIAFDQKYNQPPQQDTKQDNAQHENALQKDAPRNGYKQDAPQPNAQCKDNQQDTKQYDAHSHKKHAIKFFRPPYGKFSHTVLEQAERMGYKTVLWSNAIVDWHKEPYNVQQATQKILQRTHNGQILLLHAINPSVLPLLTQILPKIKSQGYTFGTPQDLSQIPSNFAKGNFDNTHS